MSEIKLEIASVPDRDNVVVELWLNDNLLAEVNNDKEVLEIELYAGDFRIKLPLDDLITALQKAKEEILS